MARVVLVADDSPSIQKRALGILKGEGFEVETVSNGVAAIKRLAVLHPVVILADVSMPGRDGYEVCDFVKKSAELSEVPVLLVASDMEPYDDARGAEVRADGIIKKPFEAHELSSIVMKFAAQYEVATATLAAPTEASAPPESTQEFGISQESADDMPTLVQHSAPDFSAIAEGVAFAEPVVVEIPGFSTGSDVAGVALKHSTARTEGENTAAPAPTQEFVDMFTPPEPHSAAIEENPLVVEEPPASDLYPQVDAGRSPSFLEGMEAVTPEPVFVEEPPAQTPERRTPTREFSTPIFRAPLEIAEPVLKDEAVAPPPATEPTELPAAEPQLEVEAPIAPPETLGAQPLVPPDISTSAGATSLDSFSLDDATAGQVHFASEVADFPLQEAAPAEAPAAELAHAEFAPLEATQDAPVEEAPAAATNESAPAVVPEGFAHVGAPPGEPAYAEAAPVEVAQDAPGGEARPAAAEDFVRLASHEEFAPAEAPPVEPAYAEGVPAEAAQYTPVGEVPATETIPQESAPEWIRAGTAPPEAATEWVPVETAPPGSVPEWVPAETAPPVAAVEVEPRESTSQAAVPSPVLDWDLLYSIVHKVVVKMSPPPLPVEAVESISRRLAEEIASEIISEISRPSE